MFFSSEMVSYIVEQTNIYSVQLRSKFHTDQNEIEKYIGILMKMGLVHTLKYAMYWSSETRYPPVADVISCNRFTDLNTHIHFNNNSKLVTNRDDAAYNRYYKIQPVLATLRESCLRIEPEERMSIAEQMILPYKGKNSLRQYLPKKPKNGVLKSLARCGVSELTYDFSFYDGKGSDVQISSGYQPGDFVIKLSETLPKGMNF